MFGCNWQSNFVLVSAYSCVPQYFPTVSLNSSYCVTLYNVLLIVLCFIETLSRFAYAFVALQSDITIVVLSADIRIRIAVGSELKEVAECQTRFISHLLFYSEIVQ